MIKPSCNRPLSLSVLYLCQFHLQMLLISCPFWMANMLSTELKRIWDYGTHNSFRTGTYIEWSVEDMYRVNIHSRLANKIYLRIADQKIHNFDDLFEMVKKIEWSDRLKPWHPFTIQIETRKSWVDSRKAWQKITHKAILSKLYPDQEDIQFDRAKQPLEIFVSAVGSFVQIFINTSGAWLHNRW